MMMLRANVKCYQLAKSMDGVKITDLMRRIFFPKRD